MKCKQKASCKCLTWSPKDTQKGENYLRLSSHRRLQPSLPATPKGAQAVKQNRNRLLALDCWDGYKRNDSREPRLLHLPIPRKTLNSLTLNTWFFFYSNVLMFWIPSLCCKNTYTPWPSPLASLKQPQSYLRCCVLSPSPQFCSANKT